MRKIPCRFYSKTLGTFISKKYFINEASYSWKSELWELKKSWKESWKELRAEKELKKRVIKLSNLLIKLILSTFFSIYRITILQIYSIIFDFFDAIWRKNTATRYVTYCIELYLIVSRFDLYYIGPNPNMYLRNVKISLLQFMLLIGTVSIKLFPLGAVTIGHWRCWAPISKPQYDWALALLSANREITIFQNWTKEI